MLGFCHMELGEGSAGVRILGQREEKWGNCPSQSVLVVKVDIHLCCFHQCFVEDVCCSTGVTTQATYFNVESVFVVKCGGVGISLTFGLYVHVKKVKMAQFHVQHVWASGGSR